MKRGFQSTVWILWGVILLGSYWIYLPPINPMSSEFWFFMIWVLVLLAGAFFLLSAINTISAGKKVLQNNKVGRHGVARDVTIDFKRYLKPLGFSLTLATIIFLLMTVLSFFNSRIFRAKSYANIITVTEKDFIEDFPETDITKLALLDRSSAEKIGDTYLGTIDKVSQFGISDDYRQITIGEQPYRVSPLEYKSFWKWLSNHNEGIGYYVKVNQTTGKAELAKLDQGMKYSDSEYFFNDTMRHLRLRYPFTIFGDPSFEVDDEGNPYYVATIYEPKFMLSANDPKGVVLLNAVTGETKEYGLADIPNWVDRVFSANNVITRIDDYYTYQKGFWNTVFSQTGVKETTDIYNYISIGSDIYLYTGITSATADSSNLGFILVNMRTREIVNYKLASATESAAQESAEGEVQEKNYSATAPSLVKLNGKAFYLVSLKDDAGLVKSYALVDAEDYQQVTVNNDIASLIAQFTDADTGVLSGVGTNGSTTKKSSISGMVEALAVQTINGTTIYYLQSGETIYKVKASTTTPDNLPFIKVGDQFAGELSKDNYLTNLTLKPTE
ncbi:hypothetical protein [Streptococcus sp. S784/96/1]|uniref:hypothetical protein n=1 Tax=Streptococcus sp. S784/96/1 TaxID=2653499 RepID=UPI001389BF3D|nr:hypothetical protein [Streptococcus sp. S784/96/1]